MQYDLAAELEARPLCRETRAYCSNVGDIVSMKHFEEIAVDEEGHIDFLEPRIALHEKLGAERFIQLNAGTFNDG
jgi:bacterioferritin